jgi:hypothetical protein
LSGTGKEKSGSYNYVPNRLNRGQVRKGEEMRLKEDDNNRYIKNGYKDRDDYLTTLADDYGIDSIIVNELAGMLGPSEDFDGLVTELEDSYNAGLLDDFRVKDPVETLDPDE